MAKMMPFDELLDLIERDPITGAQEAQKRNGGVRILNYQSSVSAGALFRRLKGSPALISGFYGLPFWGSDDDKKSYTKNLKHLNKHCHQYVYGARDGTEGKRAEDHAFATQEYLDDDSKDIDGLLEALKNGGGFQGLRKATPARSPSNRLAQFAATERKHSQRENDRDDTGTHHAEKAALPAATKTGGGPPKDTLPKITMKKVFEHLLITLEPEELRPFLAGQSKVGDRYAVMVERDADDPNGMLIWRAVEIAELTADAE